MNIRFQFCKTFVRFCGAALVCTVASSAYAEFYKYKDSSGALVITNRIEDVPKKYRKNVKIVWDDELTAKDPHARRMAAAEANRQEQERRQQQQQKEKQQAGPGLKANDGKMLVITIDEETGQVIRRFE